MCASDVIKKHHCGWAVFKRILSENNVEYDNRRDFKKIYKLNEPEFLKAAEMFNNGIKVPKIAEYFNVPRGTIYKMFQRFNFNYLTV